MRHKGYFKKCMGILVLLAVILSQTGEAEAVSLSSITSDSIREKEGHPRRRMRRNSFSQP